MGSSLRTLLAIALLGFGITASGAARGSPMFLQAIRVLFLPLFGTGRLRGAMLLWLSEAISPASSCARLLARAVASSRPLFPGHRRHALPRVGRYENLSAVSRLPRPAKMFRHRT